MVCRSRAVAASTTAALTAWLALSKAGALGPAEGAKQAAGIMGLGQSEFGLACWGRTATGTLATCKPSACGSGAAQDIADSRALRPPGNLDGPTSVPGYGLHEMI